MLELPLDAHEESVGAVVYMLVEVDDVAFVDGDEIGDFGDDARGVLTVDEQNGVPLVVHDIFFVVYRGAKIPLFFKCMPHYCQFVALPSVGKQFDYLCAALTKRI